MPRRDFSKVAFAATGDTNSIPTPSQPDGSVSLQTGWGFDYQRDNGAGGGTPDPLAKNIDREDMNGILNELSASVGEIQQNGKPIWAATAAPYPLNAEVRYATDNKNYRSTISNNNSTPGSNADWLDVSSGGTGRLLNIQRFTTPGSFTYTPTPGTGSIFIKVQAGGGGGGGANATASGVAAAGSGGGAGGYAESRLTSGFSGLAVVIGAGGAGTGGAGGSGGASSFGALITTSGGSGGTNSPGTGSFPVQQIGGGGGTSSGGNLRSPRGGDGKAAVFLASGNSISGAGGDSSLYPGGAARVGTNGAGGTGIQGSGGSGGISQNGGAAANGGPGGSGYAEIWEYSL